MGVVVAADEQDLQPVVSTAPLEERAIERRNAPCRRVQEITEDDQTSCTRARDKSAQPFQIGLRGAAWHRHATRAKRGRLAEMNVRNEERRLRRPQQCARCEEFDTLAGQARDESMVARERLAWRARQQRQRAGRHRVQGREEDALRTRRDVAQTCVLIVNEPHGVACKTRGAARTMPRFAANLSMMFNEVPFLDRFGEAARAGFRAVEFMSPYEFAVEDVAERVRANDLQVVLFNAAIGSPASNERGLASLPGRESDFEVSIAQALRYAQALQCPRLHVMAGLLPHDADADERARRVRTYTRNLGHAAERARPLGVSVLIEPINTRDIPGYLLNTQAEAHAVREAVGASNLLVQMDFYHCQIVEGDIAERFRRYQRHVGHIQVAGVPGRHEPDIGEVNYPYLFALLDELGYDGWVGCEYRPKTTTAAGLGWVVPWLDAYPNPQ